MLLNFMGQLSSSLAILTFLISIHIICVDSSPIPSTQWPGSDRFSCTVPSNTNYFLNGFSTTPQGPQQTQATQPMELSQTGYPRLPDLAAQTENPSPPPQTVTSARRPRSHQRPRRSALCTKGCGRTFPRRNHIFQKHFEECSGSTGTSTGVPIPDPELTLICGINHCLKVLLVSCRNNQLLSHEKDKHKMELPPIPEVCEGCGKGMSRRRFNFLQHVSTCLKPGAVPPGYERCVLEGCKAVLVSAGNSKRRHYMLDHPGIEVPDPVSIVDVQKGSVPWCRGCFRWWLDTEPGKDIHEEMCLRTAQTTF